MNLPTLLKAALRIGGSDGDNPEAALVDAESAITELGQAIPAPASLGQCHPNSRDHAARRAAARPVLQ